MATPDGFKGRYADDIGIPPNVINGWIRTSRKHGFIVGIFIYVIQLVILLVELGKSA